MLITLLILFLIVTIVFVVISIHECHEGEDEVAGGCLAGAIICGIITCALIWFVYDAVDELGVEKVIVQKIEMYEAENAKIEAELGDIIREYKSTENGFIEDDPQTKLDAYAQKQLQMYTNNLTIILQLKDKKLDVVRTKWILYFGG